MRDLDEYTDIELNIELNRRLTLRVEGKCDYCGQPSGCYPSCRFPNRHGQHTFLVDITDEAAGMVRHDTKEEVARSIEEVQARYADKGPGFFVTGIRPKLMSKSAPAVKAAPTFDYNGYDTHTAPG
jgi:hypothetical protein